MTRKRLELEAHLSGEELSTRYRRCHDAKEARRWHVLWLIATGSTPQQAADLVGFDSTWVRRLIRRYNHSGPDSMIDQHRLHSGGPAPRLNAAQSDALAQALEHAPDDGGLWTGPKVAAWIERVTGQKTYAQLGWVYLRQLGFTLKVPRRKHVKAASQEQQDAWKKN
jgi:transposase